ncbi:MAG: T9SS type A sorting domain-containing protein [Bacteroidia bacterium]
MKPALISIFFFFLCFDVFSQTNGVIILPDPVASMQKTRHAIAVDKNDNVWMGFKYIGLGKFANGNWTLYDSLNNGLLSNTVYALAVDAANNMWIGTKNGLQKFNGTTFQSFTTANSGLINDTISALYIKGNTVYIGTNAGLSVFDGSNWVSYTTTNSNLIGDSISAIAVTDNNDKYFATYKGLSCLAANGSWFNFDNASAGIDNKINALLADGNTLYVGANSTSYKLSNNIIQSFETFFPCMEGSNYGTYSFAKSSTDKIYFGYSLKTFYEMENNNLKRYYLKPYLSQVELAITSKDSLYITSTSKFQGSNFFAKFEPSTYTAPQVNDTMKYLDINDVKALIANEGMMHWDYIDSKYFVPKCSGKTSVFASALWVGGLDDNNQLHLAAQTYRQTGSDFFTGPLDTITHIADSVSSAYYNKIWKVERNEIEEFKYQFALGNVANNSYVIPTDVLSWPANGILNNAKMLAPFIDVNHDEKYNPHDGDYPDIKGDKFLYWVFNDTMKAHTETGGAALGVEVHASAYAYDCPQLDDSDDVMNLTTFYQYKFINRTGLNYHNMYIGLWCDVDLGKATDDYVGCDTTLDIGFVYNGDNNDDGYGYGLNPPMQNILILKGPVAANADNKDNNHNGLIDEAGETLGITCFTSYNSGSQFGNPNGAPHYYHYMKSEWGNGQHFTLGEYAQNPNNPLIDYMFPGTPYDTTQWNEGTANGTPEDRRFVMSSGPFNLNANDTATIDFAYVFTRDETAPNGLTTSIARNIKDVKKIIDWYKNDNFPSCISKTFPPIDTSNTLIIFPNPVNDILQFSLQLHSSSPQFFIYDLLGQKIISGVIKSKIINISSLSNGVYFLKIKDGDNEFMQKFLKLEKK